MTKKTDYLKFTDYEFEQDEKGYKVNTDTVYLGCFLDPMKNRTVLDIGTNTGALLLYAHQKGAGKLCGTDIHEDALKIAKRNLKRYCDDYELFCSRVQDLKLEPVDVIVCNPPFFEMNNVTPDEYLRESMFEESLPLEELFVSIRRLMKNNGEAYLIYQADRFPELYQKCLEHRLKIMKMQFIHDLGSRHALRVMVKLKVGKMSKLKVYEPIIISAGEPVHLKRSQ